MRESVCLPSSTNPGSCGVVVFCYLFFLTANCDFTESAAADDVLEYPGIAKYCHIKLTVLSSSSPSTVKDSYSPIALLRTRSILGHGCLQYARF